MKVKFFALALILALFSSIFLAIPAQAAVMIPSEGIVGAPVVLSGLTPGESYTVKWDGTSIKTGAVPAGGEITFVVPEASGEAEKAQGGVPRLRLSEKEERHEGQEEMTLN